MRDLIGRLDVVDNDAASALRVIAHFDRLADERVSAAAVVRAAAALAGCPCGLHDATRGLTRRFTPGGSPLPPGESNGWAREAVPGRPGLWIWLERTGEDGPLDALVLERAARTVQTVTGGADPRSAAQSVRIVCDSDAAERDRQDAAARLGICGAVTVVVTAVDCVDAARSAKLGDCFVTLLPGTPPVPDGVRAGATVADELDNVPFAVERAHVALRVADRVDGVGPSVVWYGELGALAHIAERFTPAEAAGMADVRRIEELLAAHPWVVDTLQAVLDQTSLRQAASALHVHHSTLQERLTWLGTRLGYSPTKPGGRQRAAVALLLWRIAQ